MSIKNRANKRAVKKISKVFTRDFKRITETGNKEIILLISYCASATILFSDLIKLQNIETKYTKKALNYLSKTYKQVRSIDLLLTQSISFFVEKISKMAEDFSVEAIKEESDRALEINNKDIDTEAMFILSNLEVIAVCMTKILSMNISRLKTTKSLITNIKYTRTYLLNTVEVLVNDTDTLPY